jgi:hypothetical protein
VPYRLAIALQTITAIIGRHGIGIWTGLSLVDGIHPNLVSKLTNLAKCRLVCHEFAFDLAPCLFADIEIRFRIDTWNRSSRITALERPTERPLRAAARVPRKLPRFAKTSLPLRRGERPISNIIRQRARSQAPRRPKPRVPEIRSSSAPTEIPHLQQIKLVNATMDASQVLSFIQKHRHLLREFNFENVVLRSGAGMRFCRD